MFSSFFKVALPLCWLLLLPSLLSSQATVSGTVRDASSSLPGAAVSLEGTDIGTVTDIDGFFQLFDVPAGDYTLKVSYIGYAAITQSISVGAESLALGVVRMEEDADLLEEVVVTAEMRNGDARAMNMVKTSDRLVNIVAAAGIGKLPDKNAGEAVQRVPAVALERDHGEGRYVSVRGTPHDWSAALINNDRLPVADEEGDSRAFSFDVFPSDLIEYIVVSKALTPDIEADAIGGSINFITKAAPEERVFNLNFGGGYNDQARKPVFNVGATWADRTANGKFGYLVSGSFYSRSWATDNFEVVYGSNYSHGVGRLELRDYNGVRQTGSFNASAEYKLGIGKVYFKALHGRWTDNEYNRKTMFYYTSGTGSNIEMQNIHNIMQMRFYGGEVGTNLALGERTKLDLRAASYHNSFGYGPVPFKGKDKRNGYHVVRFRLTKPTTFLDMVYNDSLGIIKLLGDEQIGNYAIDTIVHPVFGIITIQSDSVVGAGDDADNIQPIYLEAFGTDDFEFIGAYSELYEMIERDPIVVQTDLTHEFSKRWKLKAGLKYRHKIGEKNVGLHKWDQDITNVQTAERLLLSQFDTEPINTRGGFLQELGSNYEDNLFPFLTNDALNNFVTDYDTLLAENKVITFEESYAGAGGSYAYREDVAAAYVMGYFTPSDKWSFIGGLRAESTLLEMDGDSILGVDIDQNTSGVVGTDVIRVKASSSYLSLFPSLHVRYSPLPALNLRAAFTRSMRRPNFNEARPGSPVISPSNLIREYGNPNLRPSYAWNADLAAEYFFDNVGMVSVGVFYKYVIDHIFTTNNLGIDIYSSYVDRSFTNAENSFVLGAEFSITRRFDFLPSFWSGFGVSGNYAYIKSEMNTPGRTFAQPLPRQANHLFNIALFYELHGLTARIAANYKGPYLMELNTTPKDLTGQDPAYYHNNTEYDIFMGAYTSLDASAGYKINRHFEVFMEVNNLLNAPYLLYRGNRSRPVQTEYYSIRGQVGFKYSL